jgi:hypothetical protein
VLEKNNIVVKSVTYKHAMEAKEWDKKIDAQNGNYGLEKYQ